MSDNVTIKDASGNSKTMRSIDTTGSDLHVPVHRLDALALSGPTAQSVINTDLLTGTVNGWYEVKDFASAVIQIVAGAGISAGAVIFEQTNDNSNTTGIALAADELGVINANPITSAITIAASTRRMFAMAVTSRYVRARISTAFVGGTVQAITQFMSQTLATATVNVQQATAANLTATVSGTVTANAGTGSFTVVQATASALNAQIVGPGASGAAVSGNPVRIAGSDGTNTQNIKTDASGNLLVVQPTAGNLNATVVGTVTANAGTGSFTVAQATAGNLNATVVGSGNFTVVQATAANLNAEVQGADANGATITGNPVLVGGTDGTLARTLATDASGRAVTVGAAANGAAVAGNPVLQAGYDGTTTRTVRTDASGNQYSAPLNNIFFNDSVTNLGASATFTGTTRDVGLAAGALHGLSAFNVTAFAAVAGTVRIEMSNDNSTWRRASADTAVTANAVVTLSVPVVTRYYRAVFVNGAAAQTGFMLNSSFTAA